jgi:hypothetical protein
MTSVQPIDDAFVAERPYAPPRESVLGRLSANPTALRAGAWAGPACVLLWFIGLLMAGFIPHAPSAAKGAQSIATYYRHHTDIIRGGMFLADIGIMLLVPWACTVAVWTRRSEWNAPLLSWTQIGSAIAAATWAIGCTIMWSVAAFRAHEHGASADSIRLMNDLGWFIYLMTWTTTALWALALGLAILWDKREQPPFPRWLGYLCILGTIGMAPAGMIGIMPKSGPFNFTGLITFWIPNTDYFLLMVIITPLLFRAIRREEESGGFRRGARRPDQPALVRREEAEFTARGLS